MKINATYAPGFTIMQFNGPDQEIGRLWQEGGKLQFEGNASEAAKQLFEHVIKENNGYLSLIEEQNNGLHGELLALEHDRDHWKANHKTEVERARLLKNRTDLPIERKMLYEALRLNAIAEGTAIPLDAEHVVTTPEALEHVLAVYKAAVKFVKCKGRYHAELNYRALAALFGVDVPEPREPSLMEENRRDITQPVTDNISERVRMLSDDEWKKLIDLINSPASPAPALRELMQRNPRYLDQTRGGAKDE